MQNTIVNVILVMAVATALTRLLPLALPKKYYESKLLKELNQFFPTLILTLLVIYSVRSANWDISQINSLKFAYAEIISMLLAALIYKISNNMFWAIGISTLSFILFKMFL